MIAVAIVVAAGKGARLGTGTRKQYLPVGGVPLLARALGLFEQVEEVERVVAVVPRGDQDRVRAEIVARCGLRKVGDVIAGGETRCASVRAGLGAAPDCEVLVVHDGARPLCAPALVRRVIEAAREHGAAAPVVPVRDTVKRGPPGWIAETVDREPLSLAQTPQAFRADLLRRAYQAAADDASDDASDDAQLVERLGHAVAAVPGDPDNLKVTTSHDLVLCEALLRVRDAAARGRVR